MVNGETRQQRINRIRQRKARQLKRQQKAIRKGTMNINTVLDPTRTGERLI